MESFHTLNPSESFQWPPRKGMCRERIRGLANLITPSKIFFLIASLAFCRFLCVTYRNGLHRGTSKLRHSKYLKKYEPCQFDTFCWETAFYYTRAKGAVTQKFISVSKIIGYHFFYQFTIKSRLFCLRKIGFLESKDLMSNNRR